MCCAGLIGAAADSELFFGELADRLQHRESCLSRRPVGDQQRLAHQGVQQIEDGVFVCTVGYCYGTSTLEVEPAGEHRAAIQQVFLCIVEEVVGPGNRVAQGLVSNQVITGLIDTASIFGWALRLRAVRAMHDRPEVGLSRIREHREIVTALRARDADRVETLMRRHLTTGIDYVLKQARQPAPSC